MCVVGIFFETLTVAFVLASNLRRADEKRSSRVESKQADNTFRGTLLFATVSVSVYLGIFVSQYLYLSLYLADMPEWLSSGFKFKHTRTPNPQILLPRFFCLPPYEI